MFLVGSQLAFAFHASAAPATAPQTPVEISGIYPHLAYFNTSGECGTGAVVPWADRLWIVTYAPHKPKGSDDQLYEIDSALRMIARPESVGGTPANRFIHRESQQLFIGLHAIDAQGHVRTIPYEKMYGRPPVTPVISPIQRTKFITPRWKRVFTRSTFTRSPSLNFFATSNSKTVVKPISPATTARACTPAKVVFSTPTTANTVPPLS
jgi:hypothetical protein